MMNAKYILVGKTPVPEPDIVAWGKWMQTEARVVSQTDVRPGVQVSTVFLGLDHSFGREGPPVLFETMVFRDGHGHEQDRYCTWAEAERGHAAMVEQVKAEAS